VYLLIDRGRKAAQAKLDQIIDKLEKFRGIQGWLKKVMS
jgi:hypothetical protein